LFLVTFFILILKEVAFLLVDDLFQVEDFHASASETPRDASDVNTGQFVVVFDVIE
jgi:hypothetical protein